MPAPARRHLDANSKCWDKQVPWHTCSTDARSTFGNPLCRPAPRRCLGPSPGENHAKQRPLH
eukprot:8452492-Alexandrium_andersonii.AAC.1